MEHKPWCRCIWILLEPLACRIGNYAKQQAYALQLQKSYPQNTSYPWWIAVASSLQARALVLGQEDEEALPPLVLLTARLMERAWQRTPEPGRTYEMLLVYLDALHAAGEHEAALKVWLVHEMALQLTNYYQKACVVTV